jgi:hypothetical protein
VLWVAKREKWRISWAALGVLAALGTQKLLGEKNAISVPLVSPYTPRGE